jgi:hypothetical protein
MNSFVNVTEMLAPDRKSGLTTSYFPPSCNFSLAQSTNSGDSAGSLSAIS